MKNTMFSFKLYKALRYILDVKLPLEIAICQGKMRIHAREVKMNSDFIHFTANASPQGRQSW